MGSRDDGARHCRYRARGRTSRRRVGRWVRIGVDGQTRVRLAGPKYLPNRQTWDFAAGPQIMIGTRHFYGALTGGPATMGLLSPNVGWTVVASVGGSTL